MKIDEFVKSRIHQVFGVSCLVFGMKYTMLYRHVRILNTKYQIQNTSVKKDAIILAIKTFLDVRRREKLAGLIGNYDFGYSLKDLEKMRKDG